MELSENTKKLVERYQVWHQSLQPKSGVSTIEVDEVAAKVAAFYEKIRGVVDWKEEHLLRKTAIERILKRRMFFHVSNEDIAEPFLHELIRGGHFPNRSIEVEKIEEVRNVIAKYTYLIAQSKQRNLEDWFLKIAAAEIEETLSPPLRERALIEYMSEDLIEKIKTRGMKGFSITDQELQLQVYVACHRALFKLDDTTITYHIFEKAYPDWKNPSPQTLETIGKQLPQLKAHINAILSHPLSERLYQVAEQHDTPYLILGDILSEAPFTFKELILDPSRLETAIKKAYEGRHEKLKGRIGRAAFYSTVSIFITKVLVAFAIEIPFDKATQQFDPSHVGISIGIPPLLMFLLVAGAKTSSQENLQIVLLEVMKLIFKRERQEIYGIPIPRKRGATLDFVVKLVYLLTFIVSFGILVSVLLRLEFSILTTCIFLLFISLVAFAGTQIRHRARELLMEKERSGVIYGFFDIFGLPFIEVGKMLSGYLAKYNFLVVLCNFLIEVPFQFFVEFIEQWRAFLQEKKERIH